MSSFCLHAVYSITGPEAKHVWFASAPTETGLVFYAVIQIIFGTICAGTAAVAPRWPDRRFMQWFRSFLGQCARELQQWLLDGQIGVLCSDSDHFWDSVLAGTAAVAPTVTGSVLCCDSDHFWDSVCAGTATMAPTVTGSVFYVAIQIIFGTVCAGSAAVAPR